MTDHTRIRTVRTAILMIFVALLMAYSLTRESRVGAFSAGPPPGRTNAPGEANCTGCHTSFPINSGPGMLSIAGVPATYTAGQEYTITVSVMQADPPATVKYGFMVTAIDERGRQAGVFTVTDTTRTQLRTAVIANNTRNYMTHTASGSATPSPLSDKAEFSFKWTAPPAVVGKVTFYVAGNRANGSTTNQGDYIYTTSQETSPDQQTLAATSVSAASYSATLPQTVEGIVAVFGTRLASGTVIADDTDPNTPGIQLPTTLSQTTVKVRDSAGTERNAPLFFVSPTQINYLIPTGAALGVATVTITAQDGSVSGSSLQISRVSPGIFSADSTGSGPAAALVLRIKADNSQSYESVAQFSNNAWTTVPIDLGPDTDQLFLILFGTGVRNRQQLSGVTATIGSANAEVLYAGPQGDFVGSDQINLRIPRTVTRDEVEVELTAETLRSNKVKIRFRP